MSLRLILPKLSVFIGIYYLRITTWAQHGLLLLLAAAVLALGRRLEDRRNDRRPRRRAVEEVTRRRQLERRRQLVGAMERDDHATTGSLLDRPGETMTWWHKW